MKKIEYGRWEIHPGVAEVMMPAPGAGTVVWKRRITKHEGEVLYYKLWNFWVRAGVKADLAMTSAFFRDYESANANSDTLLAAVGFPWRKAETEEEIWGRIGMVWNWMRDHVVVNNSEYATISSVSGTWPSILDYAKYYVTHKQLVWAACFSKAHLFATLLGRVVYPRFRFGIAQAHHTEAGAPPTASHVFVGVYVGDRWFYLDPTAVYAVAFPAYSAKKSIGVDSFTSVDYEHPYYFKPVPLSGFDDVPYLPK